MTHLARFAPLPDATRSPHKDIRTMTHHAIRNTCRIRFAAALIAGMLLGSSTAFAQENRGERGGPRAGQESRSERNASIPDQGRRADRDGARPSQPGRVDASPRVDQGVRDMPRAAYENRIERRAPPPVRHDPRFAQQYYPARGTVIQRLPYGSRPFQYHGQPYYHSHGVWYRPNGIYFTVVGPPIGAFVSVLPYGYSVIDFGGRPYYRYDDVYYARRDNGYVVIDPPENLEQDSPAAAASDELFIYPAAGQTAEQQANDRFECHDWASEQTGYDPTRVAGGVAPEQTASRRAAYLRAMTACLEGRSYTVR